jgi:hypothetical protein
VHCSAGSNEPERLVFDPLNADLCDPEIAILSAVSRRQVAPPMAPDDTLITTIGLLASNHCQFRRPPRTYRWPEAMGPPSSECLMRARAPPKRGGSRRAHTTARRERPGEPDLLSLARKQRHAATDTESAYGRSTQQERHDCNRTAELQGRLARSDS